MRNGMQYTKCYRMLLDFFLSFSLSLFSLVISVTRLLNSCRQSTSEQKWKEHKNEHFVCRLYCEWDRKNVSSYNCIRLIINLYINEHEQALRIIFSFYFFLPRSIHFYSDTTNQTYYLKCLKSLAKSCFLSSSNTDLFKNINKLFSISKLISIQSMSYDDFEITENKFVTITVDVIFDFENTFHLGRRT